MISDAQHSCCLKYPWEYPWVYQNIADISWNIHKKYPGEFPLGLDPGRSMTSLTAGRERELKNLGWGSTKDWERNHEELVGKIKK